LIATAAQVDDGNRQRAQKKGGDHLVGREQQSATSRPHLGSRQNTIAKKPHRRARGDEQISTADEAVCPIFLDGLSRPLSLRFGRNRASRRERTQR
jgi:hypothetical protein